MIEPNKLFKGLTVTINTNEDCNLRCAYCYEINKKHKVINLEDAYKFIDYILEDPDPIGVKGTKDEWILKDGLILDFIGGDSLMHPEIVDKVLSYFEYKAMSISHRWSTSWRASISTNGTLFGNPEVQNLIDKWSRNLSLSVSIDGCKAIHDKYRVDNSGKGTMDAIRQWWPWLKEHAPDAVTHTKATCSKESIPYLFESLKFLHETLGITYINQNFIMEDTGCTEKDYEMLDEQFKLCTEYLFDHRKDLYWSMYDIDALNPSASNANNTNCSWCGSGSMPALSVDGDIYPCFRWLPHASSKQTTVPFIVGNAKEGFIHKENFKKIKKLTRKDVSSAKCLSCFYEPACPYCIAGCFYENGIDENGVIARTTHICDITKIRVNNALKYWDKVFKADGKEGTRVDVIGILSNKEICSILNCDSKGVNHNN